MKVFLGQHGTPYRKRTVLTGSYLNIPPHPPDKAGEGRGLSHLLGQPDKTPEGIRSLGRLKSWKWSQPFALGLPEKEFGECHDKSSLAFPQFWNVLLQNPCVCCRALCVRANGQRCRLPPGRVSALAAPSHVSKFGFPALL